MLEVDQYGYPKTIEEYIKKLLKNTEDNTKNLKRLSEFFQ